MNFIAARLLAVLTEEEAFWTLTQIVECLLPIDYYSNLIGVLLDLKVFQEMLRKKMPKLCKQFDSMEFDLDLLLTKWFICLFVNHMPIETELLVWDLFFIKGTAVLFRVAMTLFRLMEKDIMACEDLSDVFQIVNNFSLTVQ